MVALIELSKEKKPEKRKSPLNKFQSKTADKESHSTWSGRRKSLIKTEDGDGDHSVSIDISLVSYLC